MNEKPTERYFSIAIIAFSALVGCSVDPFYDWTGADQSRPVAILWQIPMGIVLGVFLLAIATWWLPIRRQLTGNNSVFQIQLIQVLLLTAIVAALSTLLNWIPTAISIIVLVGSLGWLVSRCVRFSNERWPVAAMLGAMYLPFLWFYRTEGVELFEIAELAVSLPSLVPKAIVSRITDTHISEAMWSGTLLTSFQVLLGTFAIRLGPKTAFVCTLFFFVVSMIGSLFLNALMRI